MHDEAVTTHERRRSLALAGIGIVCFAAFLALVWYSASTLLLIFAGILFGVFLDALTRLLGRLVPLGHTIRLAIVGTVLAIAFVSLLAFGGVIIADQASNLAQTLREQIGEVRDWLESRGLNAGFLEFGQEDQPGEESSREDTASRSGTTEDIIDQEEQPGQPDGFLSGSGTILNQAFTFINVVFAAVGNFLVIIFLGLFVAAQPGVYRKGLVRLVPPRHRDRAAIVLHDTGETLRMWLLGQSVTMSVIFLFTWLGLTLVGVGGALILGIQAGLLAFIPNIGPLIAGVIIMLASLASGPVATIGGLAVYLLVQTLESYILTPIVQDRALDIPPAVIFAGQIMFGVLFGIWGLALALPLMAVTKVMLDRLYIEDVLEKPRESAR